MLYFLTGDIQTGKTRWLQKLVDELEARGTMSFGVLAPGTWVKHVDESGAESLEKTGIDNVLLPARTLVPFARRRDLARNAGSFDASSQSARAQLGWAIDDAAIDAVNAHFEGLAARASSGDAEPGLLVVDELGQLELCRNEGLTAAVRLLEAGATPAFPHAIAVVRRQLLETAQARFANAPWNGTDVIGAK